MLLLIISQYESQRADFGVKEAQPQIMHPSCENPASAPAVECWLRQSGGNFQMVWCKASNIVLLAKVSGFTMTEKISDHK